MRGWVFCAWPAIDYEGDIDTFQLIPAAEGTLTFTAVAHAGALKPHLQVYDQDGKPVRPASLDTTNQLSRLSVQTIRHAGYFLAVRSEDEQARGEYTLVVRFQQNDQE